MDFILRDTLSLISNEPHKSEIISMNILARNCQFVFFMLTCAQIFAAPSYYTTHNRSSSETQLSVSETRSYSFKTAAKSSTKIEWWLLQLACYGQTRPHQCKAVIQAETNSAHPVRIGMLTIDMKSGELFPKYNSNNGYTMSVIGAGEVHIYKNPNTTFQ